MCRNQKMQNGIAVIKPPRNTPVENNSSFSPPGRPKYVCQLMTASKTRAPKKPTAIVSTIASVVRDGSSPSRRA